MMESEVICIMEPKNTYPMIFVHGMFGWGADEGIDKKLPYWGATTGNLMEFLQESGYECYSVSVGPLSSAWDRACELYARLMGTTVDYGKAHSDKFGHRRYGRSYDKPLFEGFSPEKKIHLIGHSFGGITIRLFAYLMAYGCDAEKAVTREDDLSGLFTGGHADWIESVTAICAPHNGTVTFEVAEKYKLMPLVEGIAFNWVNIVGRTGLQSKSAVDFHLEQYGINNTPGKEDRHDFFQAKRSLKKTKDNIKYDMSPEGSHLMNDQIAQILPDVYYFSYYFNSVGKKSETKEKLSATKTDFPFLYMTSNLIMFDTRKKMQKGEATYDDFANDGLVNIGSAKHPDNQPFRDFDPDNIETGVWQVMPEQEGDHGTAIGLFADAEKTHQFYLDLMDLLCGLEPALEPAE